MKVSPRTAVIFDLDGTLVDSLPDVLAAINKTLIMHGRPPINLPCLKDMVGDGAYVMIDRAFRFGGIVPGEGIVRRAVADYSEFYRQAPMVHSQLYPGVVETLDALAGDACPVAICTNKPGALAEAVIESAGISRYFCAVVGGEYHARKPQAGHLLETLRRMGRPQEGAVMIGDSENDILAAKAAAIPVIAVTWGYGGAGIRELGADDVVDSAGELLDALNTLGVGTKRPPL